MEESPGGGVRISATASRTGVLPYRLEDGSIRMEYRPPEEVFAPESLASLRGATVTEDHPPEWISPANWKTYAIGHVGDLISEDPPGMVAAPVIVQDAGALPRIGSELVECSAGYECQWDPTPGVTPEGVRYDGIQRGIRYNHLALGKEGWGRAGRNVRLRLDGGAGISLLMAIHRVDGKDFEAGSLEHTSAVDATIGKLQAELVQAKAEATKFRQDAAEATAKIPARVRLLLQAEKLIPRFDATDPAVAESPDDAIIKQVLAAQLPGLDTSAMSHDMLLGAMLTLSAKAAPAEPDADEMAPMDAAAEPAKLPPPAAQDEKKAPAFDSATAPRQARSWPEPPDQRVDSHMTEAAALVRLRERNIKRAQVTK